MPRAKKPPRLWQKKDGEWLILDAGKQHRTGSRSERGSPAPGQAEQALADYLLSRKADAPSTPRQPSQITVGRVLALYADYAAGHVKGPKVLASNIIALSGFWGDLTCDAVKASTCRKYTASRGVKSATARRELGVLQAALNQAHKEGHLIHKQQVTLPPAGPPRDRWLERDEVAAILRESPPYLRRFILISIYTGTRASATLALRWTDSTDSGWVDVDRGIIHRIGAREAESNKRRGSAKMTRRLTSHVRRWSRAGGSHVVMFKGRPVASIKKSLRMACERAGVKGVSPHVLKHTAVTWAFQAGMTMEDAADYFSTTARTLERVYRQHSPFYQDRAVSVLDRLNR